MRTYPCKDPRRCGVTKHLSANRTPACGAAPGEVVSEASSMLLSCPPSAPIHRHSFPVTRAVAGGTETWEFPVRWGTRSQVAAVASERGSDLLSVVLAGPEGDFAARALPVDTRGALPGGFVLAARAEGGVRAIVRVGAVAPPGESGDSAERVKRLEDDANWVLEASHIDVPEGLAVPPDETSLPASDQRMLAAAKALRLHALIRLVRATMRGRAAAAAVAGLSADHRASFDRFDAEFNRIVSASRMSVEALTV